jgi:hypothetical protein
MKIVTEKKRITVTYERLVLDDGFVFSDVGELCNLLEELRYSDGFFTFVNIYNDEWEKKLIELGVARKCTAGSFAKGENTQTFYEEVIAATEKSAKH